MSGKNILEPDHSSSVSGISDRLRVLEKRYKNRAEATKAFGVNRSAFDKWVAMKSIPSLEAVAKISQAANVSLDWLAFGTGVGTTAQEAAVDRATLKIDYLLMDEINRKFRKLYANYPSSDELDKVPAPYTMYWTYNDLIVIEGEAERARMLKTIISTHERSIIESKENDEQARQETPDDQDQSSVG